MKLQNLLNDWSLMRLLRLALGVYIGIQAYQTQSIPSALLTAFLLYQVATNKGCCGTSSCALPQNRNNVDTLENLDSKDTGIK